MRAISAATSVKSFSDSNPFALLQDTSPAVKQRSTILHLLHTSSPKLRHHSQNFEMRTRFLTPAYLNTGQTLAKPFVSLPTPNLPSPRSFVSCFDELLCCFSDSLVCESLEIERLPIDAALSRFLSDVLPQKIDVVEGGFRIEKPKNDDTARIEFGNVALQTTEENENFLGDESYYGIDLEQLEIPELGQFLENCFLSEQENAHIFLQVLECDDNLETIEPKLTHPHLCEIQDLVCSVGDFSQDYTTDQKLDSAEEECDFAMSEGHLLDSTFPLLEVDEMSQENFLQEDGLFLFLRNAKMHHNEQNCNLEVNYMESLGCINVDMLKKFSGNCPSRPYLEPHPLSLNVILESDFFFVGEASYMLATMGFRSKILDFESLPLVETIPFEVYQMFDTCTFEISEAFSPFGTCKEPESCELMLQKDMKLKSFYDLVVSHELAVVDDTFRSLPIPALFDDEKFGSLVDSISSVLSKLEPLPLSASDEIYLDWRLLGKDKCSFDVCASSQKLLKDTEPCDVCSDLRFDEAELVFDFFLSSDNMDDVNVDDTKMSMSSNGDDPMAEHLNELMPNMSSYDADRVAEDQVQVDTECKKVVLHNESCQQFSDLEYFLNPSKAASGRIFGLGHNIPEFTYLQSGIVFQEKKVLPASNFQMHPWIIKLHAVSMSGDVLILVDSFQENYLAICDGMQLEKLQFPSLVSGKENLLGIPEQMLMDYMRRAAIDKSCIGDQDDIIISLATLCVIKHMTWCLCFYGIHMLHHFVDKLCYRLECLKSRLDFLRYLTEDAYRKAEKERTQLHPSLALIENILLVNASQKKRLLIVAEQVLWFPLKRLLASMSISCEEAEDISVEENQIDAYIRNSRMPRADGTLLQSDCLLVSQKHISASTLLSNFDIILEYGGPYDSSKVLTVSANFTGSSCIHFLKMELNSVAKALCDGINVDQHDGFIAMLEKMLNFVPTVEDNSNYRDAVRVMTNSCLPQPLTYKLPESEPGESQSLSTDAVIIVNTRNFDKEMIISRRSTYQKILAMEKKRAQVVERDLNFPVDIVLSAAMCLAWYDCRNIGKKATASDEASSCIPLCVENIAVNVLTSLSFAFGSCILVFEGETNFLATVMESSDELYAAAATLGLDLQLFFSNSSELTENIISSSIAYAMKSCEGLFPKLLESETLAESFLTKFPSINPLSAHAILSSGSIVAEFLKCSDEGRATALQKYNLHDEGVSLLSVLCRYGEREDSKSGTTECSSSVSSAPNMHNVDSFHSLEKRKQKSVSFSHHCVDETSQYYPATEYMDVGRVASKPLHTKTPRSPWISSRVKPPDICFKEPRDQEQISDTVAMGNPPTLHKPNISHVSSGPKVVNDYAGSCLPSGHGFFPQKRKLSTTAEIGIDANLGSLLHDLHEDFMGEIDFDDRSLLGQNPSSPAKAMKFSTLSCETGQDPEAKNCRTASRLSFGRTRPKFSGELESKFNSTVLSDEDDGCTWVGDDLLSVNYDLDTTGFKYPKQPLCAGLAENPARKDNRMSPDGNDMPHNHGTPLRSAIHSADLPEGSPWTIEFLNRVRERSRLRKQSLTPNASVPCRQYSDHILKNSRIKSPSILEHYKYQGGSISRKLTDQKRKKQCAQPSYISKDEKASTSLQPSWTPVDKRAKRTLSFASSGAAGQSKLVWGGRSSHGVDNNFCI